jgi:plasmid stabilization system protein ParE
MAGFILARGGAFRPRRSLPSCARATLISPKRSKAGYPARCTGRPHRHWRLYCARQPAPCRVLCGRDRTKIVGIEERLGSFQKRDNLYEGLRHTIHERYLIFFIQRDGEVQIVRVLKSLQISSR